MSMTKEAIQHIQDSAAAPEVMAELNRKAEKPVMVIPESMRIESLERYMECASHYRMLYTAKTIKDFLNYGKEYGDNSICFVDPDTMTAMTVFDIGTIEKPGHRWHKSTLALTKTAAYRTLCKTVAVGVSQKSAADFIEEWSDHIVVRDSGGVDISVQDAVNTIRDLTIDSARKFNSVVGDFSDEKSLMERIEMFGKGSLPATIIFYCAPYHGLSERGIVLRVRMKTDGEKPLLTFKIIREDTLREDVCEEFKDIIVEGFDGAGVTTYLGTMGVD